VSPWESAAIALAGAAAGFINAVAGSGTLITFPTLLAFGVPPVTANVSNNVGLVPGAVSGAVGWRDELRGQRPRVLRLASASLTGGLVGAVLLLVLPESAFRAIVPVLIGLGVVLVALQPVINKRIEARASRSSAVRADARWLWPGVWATGVYGGYFGAAQGILLIAILGSGTADSLHRDNALKNVLSALVNGVAAVVFVVVAEVDWLIVALIAVGSVVGAWAGSKIGRRLPAALLRGVIVVVGLTALGVLLPVTTASAADSVVRSGSCSGSSTWALRGKEKERVATRHTMATGGPVARFVRLQSHREIPALWPHGRSSPAPLPALIWGA